jgi:hypothetical protein
MHYGCASFPKKNLKKVYVCVQGVFMIALNIFVIYYSKQKHGSSKINKGACER